MAHFGYWPILLPPTRSEWPVSELTIILRVGATTHGPPHENTPKTTKTHTFKLLINQQKIEIKLLNQGV